MKIYAELIGNYKKHRIKSLCVNKLRKQKERLEAALPSILDGYCDKSEKPRAEAEQEAKEFLQIIEDSASYQFGWICAQAKPCENGQPSRKVKVVREPKSDYGYGNTVLSVMGIYVFYNKSVTTIESRLTKEILL